MWVYAISDRVATTVQPTMTTEDVADRVVKTDLQTEGQDVLSTEHPPLKSTGGDDGDVVAVVESNDAAVGKEPEPVKATDEEVTQLNHISSTTSPMRCKEEQHLVSTEQQPLKALDWEVVADGECNANAVVNEWEIDVSKVKSSKENRSPILSPRDMADSDQEVS